MNGYSLMRSFKFLTQYNILVKVSLSPEYGRAKVQLITSAGFCNKTTYILSLDCSVCLHDAQLHFIYSLSQSKDMIVRGKFPSKQ